jgi:hypothetical protein
MRPGARIPVLLLLVASLLAGCSRRAAEWVTVTADDGSFRIELPGAPKRVSRSLETPAGPAPIEMWVRADSDETFIAGYTEYPAAVRAVVGEDELLDSARDGAVARVRGRLLIDEPHAQGDVHGRRIAVDAEGGRVRVRGDLYVSGRRLYQVFATTAPPDTDSPEVERFLASFRIIAPTEAHLEGQPTLEVR